MPRVLTVVTPHATKNLAVVAKLKLQQAKVSLRYTQPRIFALYYFGLLLNYVSYRVVFVGCRHQKLAHMMWVTT